MIKQKIYLPKEDWEITAYYAVTHINLDEIIQALKEAGCHGENLDTAYQNLSSGNKNSGLCFSGKGKSVLVISITSSKPQFLNSFVHELHHLSSHIATASGYNLECEDVCYISGEIAEQMYPIVNRFLCSNCNPQNRRFWR